MSDAHITPELAQAVTQLGHIRRQLKQLEMEETLLREEILGTIGDWPRTVFPLRVGSFEVRLGERKGRLDAEKAYQILSERHLLHDVPHAPRLKDGEALQALGRSLTGLSMPESTRKELVGLYQEAIDYQPQISLDVLTSLRSDARLTPEQYGACFKDGRPVIQTLLVR